jgi:hypothetical protein
MIQVTPVILCGGSGTRLRPLSRIGFPKQFLCLTGNESLFQQAAQRLAAYCISFGVPPHLHGHRQIPPPPQQHQSAAASMLASLGGLGGLAGAAAGLKNPSDQYLAFMKSNSVQDELIERFKLQDRYETQFKADTRAALTGSTRASSGKDGLITVEIDDKDPKFAAELANAHVDELQKLLARLAVT